MSAYFENVLKEKGIRNASKFKIDKDNMIISTKSRHPDPNDEILTTGKKFAFKDLFSDMQSESPY